LRRRWLPAPHSLRFTIALLLCVAHGARAADRYTIDQTVGDIRFTVRHLGLFSSHGEFQRWGGTLTIDQQHPERSQVDIVIRAGSVFVPWEDGAALLRSPPYFDVADFPSIHFTSVSINPLGTNQYAIDGILRLRGVTLSQEFDAKLIDRRVDPVSKSEIADFRVAGTLHRSLFGMTADPMFISDAVAVVIRVRLRLGEALRDH
jgi:polyisoprenoid-binding protein YceI